MPMLDQVVQLFGVDRKSLLVVGTGEEKAAHVNKERKPQVPFPSSQQLLVGPEQLKGRVMVSLQSLDADRVASRSASKSEV